MTDTTAAFSDVTSFDGRIFVLGDYRRVVRAIGGSVAVGLGAVAAVCALIAVVTLTAAWIVNTAVSSNPHLHARASMGPGAIAISDQYPGAPSTATISTAAVAVPADARQITFEAKWALATIPAPVPPRAAPPAAAPTGPPAVAPKVIAEGADAVPLPRPRPSDGMPDQAQHDIARTPEGEGTPRVAVAAPPPPAAAKSVPAPQMANKSISLPGSDSRTAVYDISAHTVYLPGGERLEAHSGLYDKMDDPRYIHVKMRGPTPPNVYELTLREQLFHGVRAIRLNPVDENKMFGRDGMLAHTYMLGPNGQSNGCVSFRDYDRFLHAFLRGEVDRLVVVSHLGDTPVPVAARSRRVHGGRYASNDPPVQPPAFTW